MLRYDTKIRKIKKLKILTYKEGFFGYILLMEELHTDSIDRGSEAIYRPGHVPG
jgi:hypothetical protein